MFIYLLLYDTSRPVYLAVIMAGTQVHNWKSMSYGRGLFFTFSMKIYIS